MSEGAEGFKHSNIISSWFVFKVHFIHIFAVHIYPHFSDEALALH